MVDLTPDSGRKGTSPTERAALVAGATRGAVRGIAVQLGAVGATVHVTGRTTGTQRSEMNRPETIDETADGVTEANRRDAIAHAPHSAISESSAFVGRAVAALAQDPEVARRNGQSLSSGRPAQVYGFTDLDDSRPDAWRYVPEVQDTGLSADVTGYR
ncbi:hypothetical protein [Streptomyces sp. NPDC051286]|uniref:hypothetical protein n=1 Tax=Streptomyces sp. NPDC051286 TaxID=3365647 RepID=UPI0037BB37CA